MHEDMNNSLSPVRASRLSLSVGLVAIGLVAATMAAALLAAAAPSLFLEQVLNAAYAIAAVGGAVLGLIGVIAAVLALTGTARPSEATRMRWAALLGLVLNGLSLILFVPPVAALAFNAALAVLDRLPP